MRLEQLGGGTHMGGGRVGGEEGRELDTVARESYRRQGLGLGNECRVVGHEGVASRNV